MTAPMLEIKSLSIAYGAIEAVRNVSLAVAVGSIVTVIGANGAGKTSLLNAAMGMIASSGRVALDGIDQADAPVEARVANGMVLVPERRELFASMSVEDNLRLGAFRSGARSAMEDGLESVFQRFPRLRERRRQSAGTLSGGERQMLALGRAIMTRPRLLMLDEPSLGLAPRIVGEAMRAIAALRESGVSILLVEQNARAALAVADYGYVMELGAVALEGAASELARDARVIESYLGLGAARASG
jgi:branched-chain amino acid transport system ATP-binding protein